MKRRGDTVRYTMEEIDEMLARKTSLNEARIGCAADDPESVAGEGTSAEDCCSTEACDDER